MPPAVAWIPMRWPSGPLDIGLLEKKEGFSSKLKDTLEAWHEPTALDLLKGTPVNCLVVNWAAGHPRDKDQQRSLALLVEMGRRAGVSFVGVVSGGADKEAAVAGAHAAGLSALVMEDYNGKSDFPIIPLGSAAALPWHSGAPVVALKDSRWPGVGAGVTRESEDTNAGPTGLLWIDSNIPLGQLARAFSASKPVWLMFEPRPKSGSLPPEAYCRAIADAGAASTQWVVALDADLRAALLHGNGDARSTWKTLARQLSFFKNRRQWDEYQPLGTVGVLSDFSGPNRNLGEEILGTIARRNLPFQVILKSKAATPTLTGLKAVVCLDQGTPTSALQQKLLAFVYQGGVLLASQQWGGAATGTPGGRHARYEIRNLGKGRLAIAKEESPDPFLVARDVHALVDRANDPLRLYNITAAVSKYAAAPGGNRALVQFVNFAQRDPNDGITVWLQRTYRSALLWEPGAETGTPVKIVPELGGASVQLPSVAVYAGIELS